MAETPVTYSGSCHCGAVTFRFTGEAIVNAMRCNCSICRRRNAIMSAAYYPPDRFEMLTGTEALSVYRFEPCMVNHYFCSRCGIYPFHDAVNDPSVGYRVNLGCVEGIDAHALPIRVFDGADTWRYLDDT